MKIAVDIDSTLLDVMNPLIEYHNKNHKTEHKLDDFKTHSLEAVWGGTRNAALYEVDEFYTTEEFKNIQPVDGAVSSIKKLAIGNTLYAITSRTETTRQVTEYQLREHFPRCFSDVFFVNSYSNNHVAVEKVYYFNKIKADLIIEDCVDHVKNLPPKMKAIILDYPWNQEKLPENVERAMNWKHILKLIKEM